MTVVKKLDFGSYLDGGVEGEILLPRRYEPVGLEIGQELDVFLYFDSEDRIVATTETPKAQVGEVAYLEVKQLTSPGAFLDWGLPKDLLVPRREQRTPMAEGRRYIVYVYRDRVTGRIAATTKIDRYLDNTMPKYETGDEVDAIVTEFTPLGYKVVVDNLHTGLVYEGDVYEPLTIGQRLKLYVKKVREDDKIDLQPTPIGYAKVGDLGEKIMSKLEEAGGELPYGDKSDPEDIKREFGCSKKSFKMTIGTLMKSGRIELTSKGGIKQKR